MNLSWTIIGFLIVLLTGIIVGYSFKVPKEIMRSILNQAKKQSAISQSSMIKLLAWLCFVIAACSAIYSATFISRSETTIAKVIKVVEKKDEGGDIQHYPIYEYYISNGKRMEGRSTTGDGKVYSLGDEITVRFLSKTPHASIPDYFSHHWGIAIFMTVASIFLFSFSLFLNRNVKNTTEGQP